MQYSVTILYRKKLPETLAYTSYKEADSSALRAAHCDGVLTVYVNDAEGELIQEYIGETCAPSEYANLED